MKESIKKAIDDLKAIANKTKGGFHIYLKDEYQLMKLCEYLEKRWRGYGLKVTNLVTFRNGELSVCLNFGEYPGEWLVFNFQHSTEEDSVGIILMGCDENFFAYIDTYSPYPEEGATFDELKSKLESVPA